MDEAESEPKFKKESKEASLSGDIRAILTQVKYAKNLLKRAPDLDEIVNYGLPFEFKLKYAGRREDIERILKAAEEKGYVRTNEKGQYIETKKGGNLSSLGYVKEE